MKLALAMMIPLALCGQMRDNQMHDNKAKELTCDNYGYGNYDRRARACEMREQTFPSTGRIVASPGSNGGVTVKGWSRNDVLVRTRVEAWAYRDADASTLLKQVSVSDSGGTIIPKGPETNDDRWWTVSFEIFVPRNSNIGATTHNGGIMVSDVQGTIVAESNNGGIHLARVAGDVSGTTHNGGIMAELLGKSWQGRQLELDTHNGGITVSMPEGYSAHVRAETSHGNIRSDFPITVTGRIWPRTLDTNLGSGGPLIHITTNNGGINLRRG